MKGRISNRAKRIREISKGIAQVINAMFLLFFSCEDISNVQNISRVFNYFSATDPANATFMDVITVRYYRG